MGWVDRVSQYRVIQERGCSVTTTTATTTTAAVVVASSSGESSVQKGCHVVHISPRLAVDDRGAQFTQTYLLETLDEEVQVAL